MDSEGSLNQPPDGERPAAFRLERLGATLSALLRPAERRGLVGVLLIAGALGLLNVLMVPKFRAADEPRHVAYALLLADGEWPRVTDPLPLDRLGVTRIMDSGVYMAAANHPPLYYWIVGLPLKFAADRGNLAPGVRTARLITLAFGLTALVYVYLIGMLLVPGRPAVALTATMLTGIVPTYLNTCSIAYNDSLGVLTSVAAMHGGLSVLVRGPSRGRLAATAIWMALALFTRITGALVVGPALLATMAGVAWHVEGRASKRLLRAAGIGTLLVLIIAASSGWFYWRNYRLYGDLTASAALLKLFNRRPNGTFGDLITTPGLWADMFDLLWMRLAGHVRLVTSLGLLVAIATAAPVLLLPKTLWHVAKARALAARLREPRLWGFAVSGLALVCVIVPMFVFHARGGSLNMRYMLAVLWLPALLLALGLAAVRSPLPGQVVATLLVGSSAHVHELYGQSLITRGKVTVLGIQAALAQAGIRSASFWFVAAAIAVGAGLVLFLAATAELHRRIDDVEPADPLPG